MKSTIDYSYLGMTPEAAAEWQRQAEREFELWAKSKFCDAIRSNNFYEIQQTALMSWLMNGDACVLVEYERPTKFFPYGLRVRLIESDRVSTPHTTGNTVNLYAKDLQTGNRIYNGVELNDAGQIVAYHICSTYPSSTDPIDRWINIVTIFDYIENNFKLSFFQNVDDLTNYRLIDEVVSGFNIQLNGLQGSDDIAGGEIVFDHEENPIANILGGHIKFHTRIGGYVPAEDIENVFEFDPTITQAALEGGAE